LGGAEVFGGGEEGEGLVLLLGCEFVARKGKLDEGDGFGRGIRTRLERSFFNLSALTSFAFSTNSSLSPTVIISDTTSPNTPRFTTLGGE
jgi:hypothetical protein